VIALKKLKCSEGMALSEGLSHHILREVSILHKLKDHPNIVRLNDFQFAPSPSNRFFVFNFEFAEEGDL
jgi:serine/threonine protein kinase